MGPRIAMHTASIMHGGVPTLSTLFSDACMKLYNILRIAKQKRNCAIIITPKKIDLFDGFVGLSSVLDEHTVYSSGIAISNRHDSSHHHCNID